MVSEQEEFRKHLLVVDDDVDMVAYLRHLLQETYRISVAHNGVDALELAAAHVFDGVLVDLLLPRIDGAAVVRTLRAQGTQAPIVLTSVHNDLAAHAERSGACGYLPKPYDFFTIHATIDGLFARKVC